MIIISIKGKIAFEVLKQHFHHRQW